MKTKRRLVPIFLTGLFLSALLLTACRISVLPDETRKNEKDGEPTTCTLSIRCDNALGKTSEKADILPDDGVMLAETTVAFSEGESVFDVLYRETRERKIHMEFSETPLYGSTYIEGIGNLYEFDCGSLSGWMYKVNGIFPQYGCSEYTVLEGDKIEWVYTCDLGKDVGCEDFSEEESEA